ncbi:trichohyalin-like [Mya arenaria]|uniref:trichohyalin-like n=1 Tax=Mya arenaria TaxID=6604 RepID=UPI0022E348E0|nr:trichohyalin-like [Mya arenaria]
MSGHQVVYGPRTAKSDQRFDAGRNLSNKDTEIENIIRTWKGEVKESNTLNPKDEMKILRNWGYLKKKLPVNQVIDPFIEKCVVTPEQWLQIKSSGKGDADLTEDLLYVILKRPPDVYPSMLAALRALGLSQVAQQLEGTRENISLSSSLSSGGSLRQIGRPTKVGGTFPRPVESISVADPRNGAVGAICEEPGSAGDVVIDTTVRQHDLERMKDEIREELRQLRANIENGREADRAQLTSLQHKHDELQGDLEKATEEREKLKADIETFAELVNSLKQQMEKKQEQFEAAAERNKELERQLKSKTGQIQEELEEKERERVGLEHVLHAKEADYRVLQAALERLKVDHEERHGRLRSLTRDKVILEKEVQLLNKDKKNLEVKIKSLEQHMRILQEKHIRETSDIRQEMERQKTLLEEADRERQDLERQLYDSVRKNEGLRRSNTSLEESLQRTTDEKLHLQQRLRQADMTKYARPPYLAGTRSTRVGWNPKHLKR